MRCDGFPEEDYGLYALGSLTGPESEAIAGHLAARCETCTSEIAQYRMLWPAVGAAVPLVSPSRKLRGRVIRSVGGRASWWTMPLPLLAGACAVLLSVAAGWFLAKRLAPPPAAIALSPSYSVQIQAPAEKGETVVKEVTKEVRVPAVQTVIQTVTSPEQAAAIAALKQDLDRERQRSAELEARLTQSKPDERVASLTSRTQELEREVAQYRVLLETERKRADQNLLLAGMVSDPSLRVVNLRATERDRAVEGHALIAGNSRMLFYASKLPALPANRVYQLWLIRSNGQAIASAGIFTPDAANRGAVQVRDPSLLTGVTGIAVTDEPAGGSAQPTGHKWMIG
jgi:hypothetical protein